MESKRVAVTLTNGRSHIVDAPTGITAAEVAAVIRGERSGADVAWPGGDAGWLSFGNGQGWVRCDAIAEIMLVDYMLEEPSYGHQVYD